MTNKRVQRRWKAAVLAGMAVGYGGALLSCSGADIRLNVVNGGLAFVKAYTTGIWTALLPTPEELLHPEEAAAE